VTFAQPIHRPVAGMPGAAFAPAVSVANGLATISQVTLGTQVAQLSQIGTPEADPSPTPTPRPTQTPLPSPTPTTTSSPTPAPTLEQTNPEGNNEESAAGGEAETAQADEPAAGPDQPASQDDENDSAETPLEGTIVSNRSQNNARFFVEGMTYELAADRAIGLALPRPSSVLNLYNCDAATPESTGTCFWDPYLVTQNGLFEIYDAPDAATGARLLLREAGTPPTDQVWVQNRTEQAEQVVYKNTIYDMPPTSVNEFAVATGVPAILYVRTCISLDDQSVCEWSPKTLDAGVYYAMVNVSTPGGEPNSQITTIDLRPVVADSDAATAAVAATDTVAPTPGELICRLAVPVLNVRSGPGLLYEIIGKIRAEGTEPATVAVNGRSIDEQWLTVTPQVAEDGWITSDPNFINCEGDTNDLPIVEAPLPPPTPEPVQIVEEPAPQAEAVQPQPAEVQTAPEAQQAAEEPTAEPTATSPVTTSVAVPEGQALLVVNNGFQYDMRFTVDQRYRPQEGPSEYDLPPGGSVSIVVYPGQVAFTASSPWGGLSDNADLYLEPNQSVTLWLRFDPDPGSPGEWVLVWQ
jgi:hypothetical protein